MKGKSNSAALLAIALFVLAMGVAGTADLSRGIAQHGGRPSRAELPFPLHDDETVAVIVHMRGSADLGAVSSGDRRGTLRQLESSLRTAAGISQKSLRQMVKRRAREGTVTDIRPLWITNAIALRATAPVIREIAARSDVLRIAPDSAIQMSAAAGVPATYGTPEANLGLTNAPALWDLGVRGQGIVVANLDSGVYASHPDLSGQQRSFSSWFDPNAQHSTPVDFTGHGTWTMGVILGRDAGGTSVGVAPEAQWIAAKIFDDTGIAYVSAIHAAYQWVLNPDGDLLTPDAPQVVNNSWSFATTGCNAEFQADVQALRAAGIIPVFASGNQGPAAGTSVSPANYPEALSVGATDNTSAIYLDSGRGPSACDNSTYPDVVAPGVAIRSSDIYGGYASITGTSVAAPHVTGALALLMSAFPSVPASEIEAAVVASGVDGEPPGPDNDYGYGRIDVLAAFQALTVLYGTPTPGPTPTPTPLTPTATPTATPAEITPTPTPTATPTPEPTIPLALAGDADCDGAVSMADALTVAQFVVAVIPDVPCPAAADMNLDGQLTMSDALRIARILVGLDP
jgi:subtilisin family serine protease